MAAVPSADPVRLGIVIDTYRRLARLRQLVEALRTLTETPFELVVAADGGGDGSVEWCRREGIRVVTGINRGVCWNKNRGLFSLEALGCDPILLFEDDTIPVTPGWERDWIEGTRQWHHLSFAHGKLEGSFVAGDGTPEHPYVSRASTAQCSSISAAALRAIGYFDTRFRGYGIGHKEWTYRIMRSAFGFKRRQVGKGLPSKMKLYISGGLAGFDDLTHARGAEIIANRALYAGIRGKEAPFRLPWVNDAERAAFLAELTEAGSRPASPADAPDRSQISRPPPRVGWTWPEARNRWGWRRKAIPAKRPARPRKDPRHGSASRHAELDRRIYRGQFPRCPHRICRARRVPLHGRRGEISLRHDRHQ